MKKVYGGLRVSEERVNKELSTSKRSSCRGFFVFMRSKMLNSELLSTAWPYINFFLSAIVARLVAMRRSFLRGKPPTLEKRKADADICAIGSFKIRSRRP